MRIIKRILLVLLVLLIVLVSGFSAWAYTPLGPFPEATAAIQSNSDVTVQSGPWLTFTSSREPPTTGFIFYPGGRVDYRSYAPAARDIARQGYLVVIVPMPFNLAVFGSNRAQAVVAAHPEIKHWAIGGHSLGGAMAATYVYNHPDAMEGLVLWAAYPAGNNSLADRNLQVASIYGTHDGLATGGKIDASHALLPAGTARVPIEGGNHAGFGTYGAQPGDGAATIGPAEQQMQVVKATIDLLKSLAGGQAATD